MLGKIDLANIGNLVELLWHRVKGGTGNFENHVHVLCLIIYDFSLDFFCCISGRNVMSLVMVFYVLQHDCYMQNNLVAALFNMLATSRSQGNLHCFDQSYQPSKINL